eukprot:g45006.t1
MWELRETSIVPDDYTCVKCTQLQLLGGHIRELELDALRVIQDAEHIIDKSFSEVVTPKIHAESSWVTTRKGARVRDVLELLQIILKGEGEQLEVIVPFGPNAR